MKKKMDITTLIGLVVLGIAAGVLSGMVGIGGGILIVPFLVFSFGFSQKLAQGTSLAMLLPPIGVLSVLAYHKSNNVRWDIALILIIGFLVGSYFGAKWVNKLDNYTVKKIFAIFMIVVSIKYLFFDKKKRPTTPAQPTTTEQQQQQHPS